MIHEWCVSFTWNRYRFGAEQCLERCGTKENAEKVKQDFLKRKDISDPKVIYVDIK